MVSGTFASASRLEVASRGRPVDCWTASVVAAEGRTSDSPVGDRLVSKASNPPVPLAPNSCPVCRSAVSSVESVWAEMSKGSPETAVEVGESGGDVAPWDMGSDSGIAVPIS